MARFLIIFIMQNLNSVELTPS